MPNKIVQFAYVACSIWNISFGEGLRTWTLILEFIKKTERSWQVPLGQDVFRPSLFTATVFCTTRFLLWLLVCNCCTFYRSVFLSGISEFLYITEEEHIQQLDSKLSFTRQGNFLVLAHRLLARISFKLRKIDSKHYYRYIIFVSIT